MRGERWSRSRLEFRLGLVAAAAACALLVGAAAGSTSSEGTRSSRRYASERYAFSIPVPPGWRRSMRTLVPKLLMPREIVSLGTFPMPVGGGGNCGREPAAAIGRMRDGDALVTIQEYAVTAAMRERLARNYPPLARGLRIGRMDRSTEPTAGGGWARSEAGGRSISFATVSFSDHGRAFDALFYFGGRPSPELRRTALRMVDGMRFGARP